MPLAICAMFIQHKQVLTLIRREFGDERLAAYRGEQGDMIDFCGLWISFIGCAVL
jgi:hypothetical protein